MITIKRINVGSAGKVGAIVSLILSAITGLLFLALPSMFFSSFVNITSGSFDSVSSGANVFTALSLVTLCFIYAASLVFSTIAGGIGGMLVAFAYNITVNWIGGLEVEIEDETYGGKSKRRFSDDIYE